MLLYESGNAHLSTLRTKMFSNHSKTPLLSELTLPTRLGMCISLIPSLRQMGLWVQGQPCVHRVPGHYKVRPCPKMNRYRQIKVAKIVILYYCNIYTIHNANILVTYALHAYFTHVTYIIYNICKIIIHYKKY